MTKRVFLVGYMGVGKTTVGKVLSKRLGVEFIDLDKYIENRYRKTIAQLFDEKGEENFRKIERNALSEVSSFENVLIATGGGTPCFFDNMEVMNRSGITVYIKAEPEELVARLNASKTVRPIIRGKSPQELSGFVAQQLKERERYYTKARIIFETERLISRQDIHKTVEGIAENLKHLQS